MLRTKRSSCVKAFHEKSHLLANRVALVGLKKLVDALHSNISHSKTFAVMAMNLRVGEVMIHALNVADQDHLIGVLPCKVAERLWHFFGCLHMPVERQLARNLPVITQTIFTQHARHCRCASRILPAGTARNCTEHAGPFSR